MPPPIKRSSKMVESVKVVEAPTPRYRLIQPFYADDMFIAEGEVIEFAGIPNEAMEPLNESARVKMTEFLKALPGGRTPPLEQTVAKAMAERPREVTLPRLNEEKPLMGNLKADGSVNFDPKAEPSVKHLPQPEEPKYVRPIRAQGSIATGSPTPGSI